MKKGFTLIELLAVIVILAIIAVIATPIVLNIINESKDDAALRSADFYLDALELSVAEGVLKEKNISNDTYKIKDGNICLNTDCSDKLDVEINGETPDDNSIVVFSEGKIKEAKLYYDNKIVIKNEDSDFYMGDINKIGETHIALLESQIKKAYGKDIKIGDYVEYDETKGGTVSVEKDVKWRVLGIENGNLLLLSDQNITKKTINGESYTSDEQLLNSINEPCKAYGYGNNVVENSARSISVEDINKITGFNPYRVLKNGVYDTYHKGRITEYGSEVTYTYGTDSSGNRVINMESSTYKSKPGDLNVSLEYLEPKTFTLIDRTLLGYEDDIATNTKKSITLKNSYYWYSPEVLTNLDFNDPEDVEDYNKAEKAGIRKETPAYDMLFKNISWYKDTSYWLADVYDFISSTDVSHGIRSVILERVGDVSIIWYPIEKELSSIWDITESQGNLTGLVHSYSWTNGVRAVVALESDITLTKANDNTWNIQ